MYDVSGFRPQNEKTATLILIVFACMVVAGGLGYLLGLRNAGAGGENIYDNGNAAAGVRNEITNAGSDIGAAKSGIDNATGAADRVEARISDAQERARYVQATADEGRRILAECQSILREVRSRGTTDQAAH